MIGLGCVVCVVHTVKALKSDAVTLPDMLDIPSDYILTEKHMHTRTDVTTPRVTCWLCGISPLLPPQQPPPTNYNSNTNKGADEYRDTENEKSLSTSLTLTASTINSSILSSSSSCVAQEEDHAQNCKQEQVQESGKQFKSLCRIPMLSALSSSKNVVRQSSAHVKTLPANSGYYEHVGGMKRPTPRRRRICRFPPFKEHEINQQKIRLGANKQDASSFSLIEDAWKPAMSSLMQSNLDPARRLLQFLSHKTRTDFSQQELDLMCETLSQSYDILHAQENTDQDVLALLDEYCDWLVTILVHSRTDPAVRLFRSNSAEERFAQQVHNAGSDSLRIW